ncbi:sensor histidine kinase [Neomesorhizobium albiziae]|nr:sensor histidine kinase [Mesorhizobium albiziae]
MSAASNWPALWRTWQTLPLLDRWNGRSLAHQFLLAGGVVSLAAMVAVGLLVTKLIETGVTRNSAAATALYVDSIIAPLLPDMQTNEVLGDTVTRALDETLGQGALGRRLVSYKLWRRDGTILYSKDKSVVAIRLEMNQDLARAFAGDMTARFERIEDIESEAERAIGQPLLKIYNPVLQPWSGEVVAVSELSEIATELERSLRQAALLSWLAVASVTLGFFLVLSAIVFRGSREIGNQSHALEARVRELSDLLAQNRSLRLRVQRASQRTTALNESFLRRISADLHDGPAQLVALASLKLDSAALLDPNSSAEERERIAVAIKSSLDGAMREIRNICNGLVLPHIESAQLTEVLALAVSEHEQRTDSGIELSLSNPPQSLSPSAKICIYRFVQEALNNGYRHSNGARQSVMLTSENGQVFVEVCDNGPGFDPTVVRPGCLGLAGLRERVESLGGGFEIESSSNGTKLKMFLNIDEVNRA